MKGQMTLSYIYTFFLLLICALLFAKAMASLAKGLIVKAKIVRRAGEAQSASFLISLLRIHPYSSAPSLNTTIRQTAQGIYVCSDSQCQRVFITRAMGEEI